MASEELVRNIDVDGETGGARLSEGGVDDGRREPLGLAVAAPAVGNEDCVLGDGDGVVGRELRAVSGRAVRWPWSDGGRPRGVRGFSSEA